MRKAIPLILALAAVILLVAGVSMLKSNPANSGADANIGRVVLVSDGSQALAERGKAAPDFEITFPDGTSLRLGDLKGKPVLINFWATWCKFCEREMPAIQAAYEKYKDDGFVVIAIDSKESSGTVAEYVTDRGLSFTVAVDPTDAVFRKYRGGGWPHSVFVDKQGIVSDMYTGQLSAAQLEQFISKIR